MNPSHQASAAERWKDGQLGSLTDRTVQRETPLLLAGDIGGTKTNLALYSGDQDLRKPLLEATFPSAGYPSLEVLVGEFLSTVTGPVEAAAFGVAGPVVAGEAKVTNLSWRIREDSLCRAFGLEKVRLLNDLEAIAHGVPYVPPKDLHSLTEAEPSTTGTIAVIAPGTGLGEAFSTWDGAHYRVHASEGGHADFAPRSTLEIELLQFLLERFGHVSCERVCSGRGLPNIYAFLKESGYADEPAWLTQELAKAADPTPVIVEAGLEGSSELCATTLELFISILASEAGNLALKVMATGGVYIGGGIPPRILSAIDQRRFIEAFSSKGRLGEMLEQVPVHVLLNPKIALFGAACYGLRHL